MATTQTGFHWLAVVLVAILAMSLTSGEPLMLLDGSSTNGSDTMGNITGNATETGDASSGQYIDVRMYSKESSNDTCIPFIKSWRLDDLPESATGDPAARPEDVFVTFLNQTGEISNETLVRVGWRPANTDLDKIKGFLVVLESKISQRLSCFISVLNTSSFTSMKLNSEDYFFYDFLESLSANDDYTVFVISLPPNDQKPKLPDDPVVILRTGHFNENQTLPEYARWSPNVAVRRPYGMTSQVEVRFTENLALSPSRSYAITLKKKTKEEEEEAEPFVAFDVKCKSTDMECVTFIAVTEPEFSVWVAANDDNMCNKSCLVTGTSYFKLNNPSVVTKYEDSPITLASTSMLKVVTDIKTTGQTTTGTQEKAATAPLTSPRTTQPTQTEAEIPPPLETTAILTMPTSTLLAIVEPISSYKRANHTLVGGLLGGLTAAGLFTLLVVVFALMDKSKANKEAEKKKGYH